MTLGVQSEVGRLRQAIIHRPGLELSRLTPQNVHGLLFDDVMWARQAKIEHDAFAETLRDYGVRVHYFGELLAETLEVPAGREFVLDRVCTPELLGPALAGPVRSFLGDLDGGRLAECLVGGVLKADLKPLPCGSLTTAAHPGGRSRCPRASRRWRHPRTRCTRWPEATRTVARSAGTRGGRSAQDPGPVS
jgi:arginine deiminase